MSSDRVVDADDFAVALDDIMNGLVSGVDQHVTGAVTKATRKGASAARKKAPVREEEHPMRGEYRKSLVYKVSSKGGRISGEIGSRKYPGLVHLLEKGHATLGGGFVQPRQHMIHGKQEADRTLVEEVGNAVDRAMEEA